jgi:hypothetical protein
MVIRTAQLTVEVQGDMERAIASVRQIAQQGGGFISASNTHVERPAGQTQDQPVADLTLQVRSDAADETLTALRALGKVTSESSGSQDVTEEYVDVDANLRNLQASEEAIVSLMGKATRIDDVLALQRELTNVRGQIQRLQGRKNYLQNRADMATISISLRTPSTENAQSPAIGGWNPLAVARVGWQASLNVLRTAAEFVIVVAAFSWWLVPFVAAGVYVWQRRRQRSAPAASAPATPVP